MRAKVNASVHMQQPERGDAVTVSRLRAPPSVAVVEMFATGFPRHPISRLEPHVARAFLGAFGRNAVLLVARNRTGRDVGFLIGGSTTALDATRVAFIRAHALRIAASSARDRSLLRLLMLRLKPGKAFGNAEHAAHQLRFIAVASSARGLGIGTLLVSAFEETLAGTPGYHAWTMGGSLGAERFFAKLGFQRDIVVGTQVRMHRTLA